MAAVPVVNCAEVEIRMLLADQKIENTLWFLHDGVISSTNLDALTVGVLDWWTGDYAPLVSGLVTLREIYATDQTTPMGAASTQDGGGAPGAVGGTTLANSLALTLSFRTAVRGRSFRGRNYIAGLTTGQMTNANEVDPDVAASFISAYNSLLGADALVTGWTWVVVSRFSGVDVDGHPIPRAAGIPTEITRVVVTDLVIDNQRRRLPGRGT